jgi:CBS domain-containing protein
VAPWSIVAPGARGAAPVVHRQPRSPSGVRVWRWVGAVGVAGVAGVVGVAAAVTVPPDAPLDDVLRTMTATAVHRLPVVDGGRMVGVVTDAAIAANGHGSLTQPVDASEPHRR